MSFIPELKEFLLKGGFIYTVRKYRMDLAIVDVNGVGPCKRFPQGQVHKEDLGPFVSKSGFDSLEAWWAKIRYFVPNEADPLYLYRVEVQSSVGGCE